MKAGLCMHMISVSTLEYRPVVWQATAGTLQQELQDLKAVTKQEGVAVKDDINSLKGQLEAALAESHEDIDSLKTQMASAAADSAKDLSSVKGQLQTALADSAKETNKLREQLDMALADNKSMHQQEERAFAAGRAAMVCSPANDPLE